MKGDGTLSMGRCNSPVAARQGRHAFEIHVAAEHARSTDPVAASPFLPKAAAGDPIPNPSPSTAARQAFAKIGRPLPLFEHPRN